MHVCLGLRPKISTATLALAALALALLLVSSASEAATDNQVITKAAEIRALSPVEAGRPYRVQLRAVVTFFDPQFGYLFVHDDSGSIYVDATHMPGLSLHAGDLVTVDGVTGAGLFAPIIDRPTVQVVGKAPLPEPSHDSFDRLLTGEEDGQWVSIVGIVRSATYVAGYSTLTVATGGTRVDILLPGKQPGFEKLVDARIYARGNCGPIFNPKRQVTGFHLWTPKLDEIKVIEPARSDPFSPATHPIGNLLQFSLADRPGHRVHVQGVVTLQWPGRWLFVKDATGGLAVSTTQVVPVKLGQRVDVAGFPAPNQVFACLARCDLQAAQRLQPNCSRESNRETGARWGLRCLLGATSRPANRPGGAGRRSDARIVFRWSYLPGGFTGGTGRQTIIAHFRRQHREADGHFFDQSECGPPHS